MLRTLQSNQAVRLKANTFSAFLKTEIVGRVLLSKHRRAELFLPRAWFWKTKGKVVSMGGKGTEFSLYPLVLHGGYSSLNCRAHLKDLEIFSVAINVGCCSACIKHSAPFVALPKRLIWPSISSVL